MVGLTLLNVNVIRTRAIPKLTSDWLVKKYKIENKILLYGTVTYITALLLHIVAIHPYLGTCTVTLVFVITRHNCITWRQPVVDSIHELFVGVEALGSQPDISSW